jgi:penicillin-binding protein 2
MGLFRRERRWRSQSRQVRDVDPVRSSGRRLIVVRLVVIVLFSALSLQLLRFQVINRSSYQLEAETNRLRLVQTEPPRGLIYDRNHNQLVENIASYTAVIVPADLPKGQEQATYYRLSSIVGVPPDVIQQKVADSLKTSDPFTAVKIKEQLDQPTVLTLAELRHTMPGVDVRYDATRQYTDAALLSHVLGYTGAITQDEYAQLKARGYLLNDKVGKTGVEYVYEDQLRGTPGKQQVEIDASGRQLRTLDEVPPKPGNSLVLSIDPDLQTHITDILQQSLTQIPSPSGAAVMMDVHTGEILAYVSLPNYDVNLFSGPVDDKAFQALLDDPGKPLVDHAASDQYPPGSTFKTITGSAALQEKVATTTTTITSHGVMAIGDKTCPGNCFYDWADLGTLDFYHGVAMSSDIYFYCLAGGCPQLAVGLGADRLAKYAKDFGLGEKTGIDLPDEASGLIPTPLWKQSTQKDDKGNPLAWQLADTYFMGIGQGYVSATAVQMVRVAAALANGGDILRPHVVHEIDDGNGNVVVPPQRDVVRHVAVSNDNLAIIRQAMLMAVEGGSAATAFLPGYHIAGKTGTAEFGTAIKPAGETSNGSYSEHGWFISFAPYDNPQVALVVFDERGGGAVTAAPAAKQIWDYYFNHYKAGDLNPGATPTPAPTAGAGH